MDESRFGKLWARWDARVAAGERAPAILEDATDEDLVEILAGESKADRRYARDVIATELLNRLHKRSLSHPASARSVAESSDAALQAAQDGQAAIHHAEGILKRSGEWELGASVSASAYASLDATKATFESAKAHAETLEESLGKSRTGRELAHEAAHVAKEGREITQDLEAQMERLGKGAEGRAAADASHAIQKAADHTSRESTGLDDEMKKKDAHPH